MSRRSRQRNSRCGHNQNKKVKKTRPDASDRKTSTDAPGFFFLIFFGSSRPEHNQRPPTDTAKRRFALTPTRRKIAVSPLGAQSTPPLARCRSDVVCAQIKKRNDELKAVAKTIRFIFYCVFAWQFLGPPGGGPPAHVGGHIFVLPAPGPPIFFGLYTRGFIEKTEGSLWCLQVFRGC